MLDIKLLRENPKVIRDDLKKRNDSEKLKLLDKTIQLDSEWREELKKVEALKAERNKLSKQVNQVKKEGGDIKPILEEVKAIPEKIAEIQEGVDILFKTIRYNLMALPNILHESVPIGASDEENIEVSTFNDKPKHDFELISHVDLLPQIGAVDLERAAKISGARFYFLEGDLAMLDFALQKYAIDFMNSKGFRIVYPPFMMNREAYEGVTDLDDFEEVMYKIEDEDLYLIATSEHPMTARFKDEVLDAKDLPIKNAGISACFRKEAGAHGKDQKGIFRVHQFNKIEQIVLCNQEDSYTYFDEIFNNALELFKSLGLHGRVVNVCTGDMGTVAAKKFDIEVWYPVQDAYREVVSCSNCTDYQSRRLNIKYRTPEGNKQVHTLNSTAIATSRAVVAIVENFQDKEGNIHIPEVLWPYMNGVKVISKK
ncbi:serine--tRNA ligase [Candidatus Woesearchaeota archaeon]|nr:MAG: serine--tRNA ligase [Candidatus Woesearchaeota archaeon]